MRKRDRKKSEIGLRSSSRKKGEGEGKRSGKERRAEGRRGDSDGRKKVVKVATHVQREKQERETSDSSSCSLPTSS